MEFICGQVVTWASQSGGNWKTKTGLVCQVVPPGVKPDKRYTNLWHGASGFRGRNLI